MLIVPARRALRFMSFGKRLSVGVFAGLLSIVLVSIQFGTADSARAENRIALVIGNNRYPNLDPDRQLQKAANDANAVGDALQRDGFKVLRGTDLTRAQMVDKLYEMGALVHPGDTALFYFAGHGVALGNGNYLIPTDVPDIDEGQEMRLANQSVAEADVIATLQDKGARVSIMIFDACRDNPFRRPGLRSIGMERGLGRMPEANGVFSLYSAGYGQSALDRLSANDPNPNSVFTRVLVPLLTEPKLNLDDLAFEVREQVAKLAASTPEHHAQIPAAYNQIIGGRVYLASTGPDLVATEDPAAPAAPQVLQTPTKSPATAPEVVATRETPPASVPSATHDTRALALSMQTELNRLGCEAGVASGEWNLQSRMALLRFGQSKKLALNVDEPVPSVLDTLRAETRTVCKAEAQPVQPIPKRAPVTSVRRAPREVAQVEHRSPERTIHRRPAASASGSCFVFNGQSVCE